tara:strand:- start:363 stop:1568 length:1206 start_codon:yes stop_codon:yes gene_type:complete
MLNNYNLKNIYIFSFTIYLALYLTNQYYSLEDIISIGFTDQLKYLKIIDATSSSINVGASDQQSYRFLIPYIIGKISNLLKIQNNFILFTIIMILCNVLIIHTFNKIILYINVKKNISLIIISALIFNAYMFRPAIINPILVNDWLFTYGLLLITAYIIKKKDGYFYFGLILCAITRQTSQVLNLVFLFVILYNFIFKKKIKVDIYFYGIIINISIFICLSVISNILIGSFNKEMYIDSIFGIFYFDYDLLDLFIFIFHFFNAYIFEIILLFFLIANFEIYKKFFKFDVILIAIIGISIWAQPFLAGPSVVYGNISRLTILSLPVILVVFLSIFKELKVKSSYTIIIILLLAMSSFHHHYTYFLDFFFDYKNFHFVIINLVLNFIILTILIKINYELKIEK